MQLAVIFSAVVSRLRQGGAAPAGGGSGCGCPMDRVARPVMSALLRSRTSSVLDLRADLTHDVRQKQAVDDLVGGLRTWRLAATLGWLDIKLRYRGSMLGPFWLTLSTAVMVAALGFVYSTLFRMDLREYLPFLALSLVLWNFLSGLVTDACTCFTSAEGMIRSMRMPFTVHAGRTVVRNVLVLAHNVVVIAAVFAIFRLWPGWDGLMALPGLALWAVDSLAACVLLGAFCARFRDVPPIIGNVMQIAFFVSAIIWKPDLLGPSGWWLPLNPFYSLVEVVRAPLLGTLTPWEAWASAIAYSVALVAAASLLFARVRGRLAFWV